MCVHLCSRTNLSCIGHSVNVVMPESLRDFDSCEERTAEMENNWKQRTQLAQKDIFRISGVFYCQCQEDIDNWFFIPLFWPLSVKVVNTLQHHYTLYINKKTSEKIPFSILLWWWIDCLLKYCNSIRFSKWTCCSGWCIFLSFSVSMFFFFFSFYHASNARRMCCAFYTFGSYTFIELVTSAIWHWIHSLSYDGFCDRRKHNVAKLTMQNVCEYTLELMCGARCSAEGHFSKKIAQHFKLYGFAL